MMWELYTLKMKDHKHLVIWLKIYTFEHDANKKTQISRLLMTYVAILKLVRWIL